jgi:hypothetical protein
MRVPTRRRLVAMLLAAGGLAIATVAEAQRSTTDEAQQASRAVEITARPIAHFDRSQPSVSRFGPLEFRGGLVLSSPDKDFGGWSGLLVGANGVELFSVSDVGGWLSADITYDGNRPTGLAKARMGSLDGLGGRALEDKREQDAESLTLLEGTLERGTLAIGFERLHRIGQFRIADRQPQAPSGYMKLPPEARRMPSNQGRCEDLWSRSPSVSRGAAAITRVGCGCGVSRARSTFATMTGSISPMRRACRMAGCWCSSGTSVGPAA